MKIICIECNAKELKANRGMMDAVVDLFSGIASSVYGTCRPNNAGDEESVDDENIED